MVSQYNLDIRKTYPLYYCWRPADRHTLNVSCLLRRALHPLPSTHTVVVIVTVIRLATRPAMEAVTEERVTMSMTVTVASLSRLSVRIDVSQRALLGVVGDDDLSARRQALLQQLQFGRLDPAGLRKFDLEVHYQHALGERVLVVRHALTQNALGVAMFDHFTCARTMTDIS